MIIRKLKEVKELLAKKSKETTESPIIEEDTTEYEDDGLDYEDQYYTGVPAPPYLSGDEWFNSDPVYSEKQLDYMEQETQIKRQEREESFSVEPEDIHQTMYDIATQNTSTTIYIDPPGGSENFQENGWSSGSGLTYQ